MNKILSKVSVVKNHEYNHSYLHKPFNLVKLAASARVRAVPVSGLHVAMVRQCNTSCAYPISNKCKTVAWVGGG